MGLADEVVPSEQLKDRAVEVATEIACNAPLALRAIKSTLRLGLGDKMREVTKREAHLQFKLMRTEDAKEGITSVRERRAARFVGR